MAQSTRNPSGSNDALAPADPELARKVATAVAGVFIVVGVLGFVPGITQNLGDIAFAGRESEAKLLGLFQVSILHNIVHLGFGLVGLLAARQGRTAVLYLIAGGVVYLLLAAYGALIDHDHDANFLPVNTADDFLHLGLGLGMVGLGVYVLSKDRTGTTTRR